MFNIHAVDHIGIATENLETAIETFSKILGTKATEIVRLLDYNIKTSFFSMGNTKIELIAPLERNGPIIDFLAKRGKGIHHLCFKVDNIQKVTTSLKSNGFRLTNESLSIDAHGRKIIFLHPSTSEGVLIELVEE